MKAQLRLPALDLSWALEYKSMLLLIGHFQSAGAVWKSRWPSWAFRPNEPYGFCGRKATLNHAYRHWSQFVPNMSTDIRGHEALRHHRSFQEFSMGLIIQHFYMFFKENDTLLIASWAISVGDETSPSTWNLN